MPEGSAADLPPLEGGVAGTAAPEVGVCIRDTAEDAAPVVPPTSTELVGGSLGGSEAVVGPDGIGDMGRRPRAMRRTGGGYSPGCDGAVGEGWGGGAEGGCASCSPGLGTAAVVEGGVAGTTVKSWRACMGNPGKSTIEAGAAAGEDARVAAGGQAAGVVVGGGVASPATSIGRGSSGSADPGETVPEAQRGRVGTAKLEVGAVTGVEGGEDVAGRNDVACMSLNRGGSGAGQQGAGGAPTAS